MKRNSIKKIKKLKNVEPISCLTAYTSSIAKIVDQYVDIILIGDSLGGVIYGHSNTRSVTLEMMMNHGRSVVESTSRAFTVIDMPYGSYKNKKEALINAKKLLNYSKCQSIKLEVTNSTIQIVSHLVKNNITVISHIGVLPQSFKDFKKIKLVGKNKKKSLELLKLAKDLEDVGSSLILMECVDKTLAKKITSLLKIPTIGIGSSSYCDGQILVIDDILNIDASFHKPSFVKQYANLSLHIKKAIQSYNNEVKQKKFPLRSESKLKTKRKIN